MPARTKIQLHVTGKDGRQHAWEARVSTEWFEYLGDIVESGPLAPISQRCLKSVRDVVGLLNMAVDGEAWLAPLGITQLQLGVEVTAEDSVPVTKIRKMGPGECFLETAVAVLPLERIPKEQRPLVLFEHLLSALKEFGQRKKIGPPPLVVARKSKRRSEPGLSERAESRMEPTGPIPTCETASPFEDLDTDEYLIVRALPPDMERNAGKVMRAYEDDFEQLVGAARSQKLRDGSTGPTVMTWVVPVKTAGEPAPIRPSRSGKDGPSARGR